MNKTFRLCFVRGSFAYFTTQKLSEQWGDDWNDAPYECNAGEPYGGEGWEIKKIAFEADLEAPGDYGWSGYSVEMINKGAVAWLSSPSWSDQNVKIHAGATIREFIKAVRSVGGTVYVPIGAEADYDD